MQICTDGEVLSVMMRVIRRSVYCFKPIFAGHIALYLEPPNPKHPCLSASICGSLFFSICVHRCPFVVLHFFDAPVSEALGLTHCNEWSWGDAIS